MAEAPDVVEKGLEELEEEITCPVCQEHFREPRILPSLAQPDPRTGGSGCARLDPPVPPLLLQGVRPTTGRPSRAQPSLRVPRVPEGNRFASKRPRATAHGVFR